MALEAHPFEFVYHLYDGPLYQTRRYDSDRRSRTYAIHYAKKGAT